MELAFVEVPGLAILAQVTRVHGFGVLSVDIRDGMAGRVDPVRNVFGASGPFFLGYLGHCDAALEFGEALEPVEHVDSEVGFGHRGREFSNRTTSLSSWVLEISKITAGSLV